MNTVRYRHILSSICLFLSLGVNDVSAATTAEAVQFIVFNDNPVPGATLTYENCESLLTIDFSGLPIPVEIHWNNINWKSASVMANPTGGYSVHADCPEACMNTLLDNEKKTQLMIMGIPMLGPNFDLGAPLDQSRLWKAVDVLKQECPGFESAF